MWVVRAAKLGRSSSSAPSWLALLAIGCGSAAVSPATTVPLDLDAVRRSSSGGPDVAVVARASGELSQLSLFVDAGARDADPPQVATLAAWIAAEAAGGGVEGRVWPDAVELELPCKRAELEACLARLARGLALREVKPAQLAAARLRLANARRQSEAGDPARAADRLALAALYGEANSGLFPLGRAEDDAEATADRVGAFLTQHFGLGRVLVVASGELDADTLATTTNAAFAHAPRASRARAERGATPSVEGGVAVGVDQKAALSVAIAAADLSLAQGAALALRQRLARDALASEVRGHVFLVRGAALALLRLDTHEPLAAVRAGAHELERSRHEGVASTPLPASGEAPGALARRLGMRWAARASPRSVPLALGIGVLVAGGRADRLHVEDPDAPLRKAWLERAQTAWQEGLALGNPHTSGSAEERTASMTLDNGARIELRARASEQVAIAVRFGRGAGAEPPLLHGRTALLATLSTTACAGLSQRELAARLQALGARLEPRVDAESWGLLLTAPGSSWQAALSLALECALHPTLERDNLAAARLQLRQRLGPLGGPGELRAAAAEQLSPSAPGQLAPWGSPVRQAAVSLPSLREAWAESSRGAAAVVSAVGPVPVESAVGWAARRLSELGGKTMPADPSTRPQPAAAANETLKVNQPTLGLALWRSPMPGADPAGAQAFAAAMRAALGRTPGVTASWHDGGLSADGAWAAIALSAPPALLAAVAAQLREVAGALPVASLERAADRAFDLAERARATAAGSPGSDAEALARSLFQPPQFVPSREAVRTLAVRLSQTDPIWVPLR